MARIVQHRDPELSLLQSAIDEVAIQHKAGGGAQSVGKAIASTDRPGIEDPMVRQATSLATDVAHMRSVGADQLQPGAIPGTVATEGIAEGAKYCASLAFNYAKAKATGNKAAADQAWKLRAFRRALQCGRAHKPESRDHAAVKSSRIRFA